LLDITTGVATGLLVFSTAFTVSDDVDLSFSNFYFLSFFINLFSSFAFLPSFLSSDSSSLSDPLSDSDSSPLFFWVLLLSFVAISSILFGLTTSVVSDFESTDIVDGAVFFDSVEEASFSATFYSIS